MERHPRLKVLAHHGAGMVPHFSARLGMGPGFREVKDALPRPPLEYFRRFYADTAMFGAPHAVQCVLDFFGSDHVLFGTDMPLGPPSAVQLTIDDIEASDINESQRADVFADNAARVLGITTHKTP
jgi:predicted TIM-barrel fold metal-dependent hydrolase